MTSEISSITDVFDRAEKDQDWDGLLRRWRSLVHQQGSSITAHSELFDKLCHVGRLSDAKTVLDFALNLFPDSIELLGKRARLLTIQKDYVTAAQKWSELQEKYPLVTEFVLMAAVCYGQIGDHDFALLALESGIKHQPQQLEFWLKYVEILMFHVSPHIANEKWETQPVSFKSDHRWTLLGSRLKSLLGDLIQSKSLLASSLRDLNGGPRHEHIAQQAKLAQEEMRSLLMGFESLGGRKEGCEFGFVQRAYGAEPLGLLRFADMTPESLLLALRQQFDGVGDPRFTTLTAPYSEGDDWTSEDTRYGMRMHTFRREIGDEEYRRRLAQENCRRLAFLKRKLVEDLAAGEKIFVFKISYDTLTDEQLDRIFEAVRKYGPAVLLYVRQADAEHPPGTVLWRRDGLLVGYIERFSFGFGKDASYLGPATDCWTPIIRSANRLRLERYSAPQGCKPMNDVNRKRKIEACLDEGWTDELQREYLSILQRLNRQKCGILDFKWPGVTSPLYMRCGSSDLGNFVQMFIAKEYGFAVPFEPDRILDLGAYCGYAAIFLANRFPNADIVCVEPSSANYQMLTLNTAAYSRIRRLNVAIWGHTSKLNVADTSGGDWGIRLAEEAAGGISALSIPDVLSRAGWNTVDFLKCDIEGAELSVFRESGALVAGMVGCCAIEIHDAIAPGSSDLIRNLFDTAGFERTGSGEFEVFVRKGSIGSTSTSRVSILRPCFGVGDISLTNVQNEYWAYSMFDHDSCQLHPANHGEEPAALSRVIDLSGQSIFESEVAVANEQGHAVDFIVNVADCSNGHEIAAARISVPAGQKRRWSIPLNAQLRGPHKITLQTVMSPKSLTNHQAFANWISPAFRGAME